VRLRIDQYPATRRSGPAREHIAGVQVGREQHLLAIPPGRQGVQQLQAPQHYLPRQTGTFTATFLERAIRPPRRHLRRRTEPTGLRRSRMRGDVLGCRALSLRVREPGTIEPGILEPDSFEL